MWSLWCMWGACACCHGHLVALAFLLYAPRRYTLCTHLYNVSTNFKTCKFSEVTPEKPSLFFVILQSQWWWTIYLMSHIYHSLMMQQGFLAYKWVNFSKEFLMHMGEIFFNTLCIFSGASSSSPPLHAVACGPLFRLLSRNWASSNKLLGANMCVNVKSLLQNSCNKPG